MTPLVLLPGMMCDARLFAPQIAALSARHTLLLPNLTGADSMAALAEAVLAAAPPRFALLGLSMGGILAMEILARAPDRVARLALLDTNPFAETPEATAARGPAMARVEAGDLAGALDGIIPRYFPVPRPDLADLCRAMGLALGPAAFLSQSRALIGRADRQEALAGFHGPALVLTGAEDIVCPMDRHDRMHALMPASRLAVIPGAGHLPTLEAPGPTTEEISRWLSLT
ncbi:MAG: alpha/beta hydrolase [Amaricoccus sp.]|uniref:alpha/beta fold hydrolase n=1 Tax=Amaricoccus sp. TaxID=1872485 RepID=UPI0039E2B43B